MSVRDLVITIASDGAEFRALDGISFSIPNSKTVALVGKSGSGKSLTAQAILGILPKVARAEGSILFDDPANGAAPVDILSLDLNGPVMGKLRGGRIAMIFQEPMTSLSPLHTVGNQVTEALLLHSAVSKREAREKAEADAPARRLSGSQAQPSSPIRSSFPDGMRQRAMIAMALICRPALLIADEPTTALDVTIQAQILKLMKELQAEIGMAVLLITHDLGVVANMADEVVVLYRGRVMEAGTLEDIFRDAHHPYLQGADARRCRGSTCRRASA